MENWEALDRELAEIREKLAGRGRLEAMLAELDGEQQALRERKRALRAELDKEQADVDALEGMSLAAIWQTVLGRREEALDRERREAAAARANYQSAVRALEDVEGRWRQTRERLRALDGLEDRCRALLEEKRRRMAQSDPALGGRIRELEEKLAACRSMCREMEEAVRAGRQAAFDLDSAGGKLESAGSWGVYDMLGGGMLATAIKHSRMDAARDLMYQAQCALSRFRSELADVKVQADLGLEVGAFETFGDYFFDGFLFDWMVQSKIRDSQDSVNETRSRVEAALGKLEDLRVRTEQEAAALEAELRRLTEEA